MSLEISYKAYLIPILSTMEPSELKITLWLLSPRLICLNASVEGKEKFRSYASTIQLLLPAKLITILYLSFRASELR